MHFKTKETENQFSVKILQENVIVLINVGDNESNGYDCLCDLVFDCDKTLSSFKFENIY